MPREKDGLGRSRNEEKQGETHYWNTLCSFSELRMVEDVGQISIYENRIQWTITDFFKLPQSSCWLHSPRFRLEDKDWVLYIIPRGRKWVFSKKCLEMGLINQCDLDASFCVQLGFMRQNEEEIIISSAERVDSQEEFNAWRLIHHSELKNRIATHGTVFAFCEIRKLANATEVKTSAEELGAFASCDHYKNMILRGQACDVAIKVKHREFPVHRAILRAHSTFFARIFDEKQDGLMYMEDCDAEVFDQLLLFVYSRTLENIPSKSFPHLYGAADKYGFQDLKQQCVASMRTSLSDETVCDVIHLAKLHDESNLLKHAINFFVRYAEKILATAQWQNFNKENTEEANQLLIETLKLRPYNRIGISPNDVSEMIYRKMVALTLHPNNQISAAKRESNDFREMVYRKMIALTLHPKNQEDN